jgi:hypothetical protein
MGGQQAKAIINTVKQTNASRFYKGYAKKLAEHHQDKVQHYKSIYGGNGFGVGLSQENDGGNAGNKRMRPYTAKSTAKPRVPPHH